METILKYQARSRDWIEARGPDSLRFLNGMWTADFSRATRVGGLVSGGALLLSVKGKLVSPAVFVGFDPNHFVFSLPAGAGDGALKSMESLLVADDVDLKLFKSGQGGPFGSVLSFPLGASTEENMNNQNWIQHDVPGAQDLLARVSKTDSGLWINRGKLSQSHVELWIESGKNFSAKDSQSLTSEEYFELRFRSGVPEWGVDWAFDSMPLEFPVQEVISFHKGCYVGQEVVARATFRGKMVRSFCRFEALAGQMLKADFVYLEGQSDPPVGKITSFLGSKALGLIRLSALDAGKALVQRVSAENSQELGPLKVSIIEGIKAH